MMMTIVNGADYDDVKKGKRYKPFVTNVDLI